MKKEQQNWTNRLCQFTVNSGQERGLHIDIGVSGQKLMFDKKTK